MWCLFSIFTRSLYSIFLSSGYCHRPSSLFLQKLQKKCMPVLQGHTSANHTTATRQAVSCSLHPFFPWVHDATPSLLFGREAVTQPFENPQNTGSWKTAFNFMLVAWLPCLPSIHRSHAVDPRWFHWGEKNVFPSVRSHHLSLVKWLSVYNISARQGERRYPQE